MHWRWRWRRMYWSSKQKKRQNNWSHQRVVCNWQVVFLECMIAAVLICGSFLNKPWLIWTMSTPSCESYPDCVCVCRLATYVALQIWKLQCHLSSIWYPYTLPANLWQFPEHCTLGTKCQNRHQIRFEQTKWIWDNVYILQKDNPMQLTHAYLFFQ